MYKMTPMDFFDKFNSALGEVRFGQTHTHFLPDSNYEVFMDVQLSDGATLLRVTDFIQFGDFFFIRVMDRHERVSIVEVYKSQEKVWKVFKVNKVTVSL